MPRQVPPDPDFELLEREIEPFHVGNRTLSAALLAWFLETVWRIEPEAVVDSICDGTGDKGIDGIVVDEELSEIAVFQTKHRDNARVTQGDADLRTFKGVDVYFQDPASVDNLMRSGPNAELQNLITRLGIRERIEEGFHLTRLVFVTNALLDVAGSDYVRTVEDADLPLEVWDRSRLAPVAARTASPDLLAGSVNLKLSTSPVIHDLGGGTRLAVGLVPAPELVRLPGIGDLSIFDRNVRLGVGKTRINRELAKTISDSEEHTLFPAYHNGLTLLTHEFQTSGKKLKLDGVSVVNGCQSLLALNDNRAAVTPELQVLVKVVQLADDRDLADKITYRANNQNPVNIRDQRATDRIQRDLQAEVRALYGHRLFYAIRTGETPTAPETLDNRTAAQLVMAVYVRQPWNAVRKLRLFDQEYHTVFTKTVDAHKLMLLHLVDKAITQQRDALRLDLKSSFASVRFAIAYLVAETLRLSPQGELLLDQPGRWLPQQEADVTSALDVLAADVTESVNFYVESQEEAARPEPYDPKVVFKSAVAVRDLDRDVIQAARRAARRDSDYLFNLAPQDGAPRRSRTTAKKSSAAKKSGRPPLGT